MAGGKTLAVLGVVVAAVTAVGVWLAMSGDGPAVAPTPGSTAATDPAAPGAAPAPKAGRRAAKTEGTAALTGFVKRRRDRSPAANLPVALFRDGAELVVADTDAAGAFRLEKLPDGGPYEIRIQGADFATVRLPGIALARGETRDVGTLWLDRAVRVPVQVKDQTDAPVSGAVVEAFAAPDYSDDFDWSRAYAQMAQEPVPVARATTDAAGTAVFPELATGNWTFAASAPAHSRGAARGVSVESETDVPEVLIRLGVGHEIQGRVLDADGNPVPKAVVLAGTANDAWDVGGSAARVRTRADAGGAYRLEGVHAGFVALSAGRDGAVPVWRATVRVPGVERFDLELPATGSIEGIVTQKETGAPVEGAEVIATRWSGAYEVATATTDAKGAYRIVEFPAGQVNELRASKDGLSFAPPDDSEDGNDPRQVVSAGEPLRRDLELVRGAAVSGTVKTGDTPVAGARVVLRGGRQGHGVEWTRTATSDSSGAWRVESAPEGRAFAVAQLEGYWQKGVPENWWEVLEDDQAYANLKVAVPATGEAKLDLVLEKGALLRGRIDGPDGPVAGAKVGGGQASATSGKDGTFVLDGVRPGSAVEIGVVKKGLVVDGETKFSIPESGPAPEAALRMVRAAIVRGRVTTEDGSPLSEGRAVVVPKSDEEAHFWGPWMEMGNDLAAAGASPVLPDGSFRLDLLQPSGRFQVKVWDALHGTAESVAVEVERGRAEYVVDVRLGAGHSIRGRVVAAAGGAGVAGASVSMQRQQEQAGAVFYSGGDQLKTVYAVAGPDGRFEASGLSPGTWNVSASARGLVDGTASGVKVPAEGDVRIELSAALEITGRVVLEDGSPVAGVQVQAQPQSGSGGPGADRVVIMGGVDEESRHIATTDAKGAFRIRALAAGDWKLSVSTAWRSTVNIRGTTAGPFAAGSSDVKVVVKAGSTISGRIVSKDGKPVGNAWINANRQEQGSLEDPGAESSREEGEDTSKSGQSKSDGTFEISGLPAGTYWIHVQSQGGHRPAMKKGVAAGTRDLVITLEDGLAIEGVLVDAAGKPIQGVQLEAEPLTSPNPDDEDDDGSSFVMHSSGNGNTDSDGKFRIGGLGPGRFRVKSATWWGEGKVWVVRGGDDVASGTAGLRLIGSEGLRITGLVVDEAGAAVRGATVQPTTGDDWRQPVRTDGEGRFTVTGLAEGAKVTLTIRSSEHGQKVLRNVVPGGAELRIVLSKGLSISGRIVTADGKPAAGLQVYLRPVRSEEADPSDSFGSRTRTNTDDQGRFTATGLSEGEWTVAVFVEKAPRRFEMVEVGNARAGTTGAELRMK